MPSLHRAALATCLAATLAAEIPAQGAREPESYRLAIGLIQRGLHDDAARQLERFLTEHPAHAKVPEASYRLGGCRVELGDHAAAVVAFERALRAPDFELAAECRYRLASSLHALGRDADARAHYEGVIERFGEKHYLAAASHYGAGECARDAGDDQAALAHFVGAAAAAGDDAGFLFSGLYQSGFVLMRLGHHADAERTFGELARRFPSHEAIGELRFREGEAAYRGGRIDAAAVAYRAAIEQRGDFRDDALHGLGWCAVKQDRPDEALATFRRLVDEHADSDLVPHSRLALARLSLRGDDHAAAERELDVVLALAEIPEDLRQSALELRGLARLGLGRAEAAQRDFEVAIGANAAAATGARLHYNLGDAFAKREAWDEALASYERAGATDDAELRGEAMYAQVVALHELGRFADAAALADRLVGEQPEHRLAPLARFAAAESLFGAGRHAEALAIYDALGPQHEQAAVAAFKAAYALYLTGDAAGAADRFARIADDSAQPSGRREEALSMVAVARYEAGDGAAALEAADRYAARHDDGAFLARTETIAGRVLRSRGDLEGSVARLSRAARSESAPERAAELAIERADVLFARGDFRGARQEYERLRSGPARSAARARVGIAWCAFELGDDQACEAAITAALDDPASRDSAPGLIELLASLHHRAERWEQAAAAARRFLEQYPEHERVAQLRYALGVAQARGGNDREAVATLAALAKDGGAERMDLVHYELAWAARRSGDEPTALAAFAQVAETSREVDLVGEAELHVGEAALAAGERDRAREHFARVDGRYRGRALYRTGHAWLEDANLAAAAAAFESVAALGPDEPLEPEALFMAGETRLQLGDSRSAIAPLTRLCERMPDHERAQRARLYLGECLVRSGRPADAIGTLETFLQREADGERSAVARGHLWLGRARQERREHAAAEKAYLQVGELSDGELAAEAWFRIGECRRAGEDLAGAAAAFVNLSILYGHAEWVSRGLLEAGACYDALGQRDKGQRFYRELIERFPDSEGAKQAQDRLRGER